ncbi:BBE domain-containing protein [Paenarthrobacter sp. NPDC090520]|uniref:BBE domain-containing protein n=1 Tax=Paenarthrobacter sp. NPDC090520 TaxID=3364382 RepID=UPI00381411F5
MPYPALNVAFDGLNQKGMQGYWKANFLRELNDGAIGAHATFGSTVTSVNTSVHVYPIDGAVSRVGVQDTAFANRDMKFSPVIATQWVDPADNDANIAWARNYAEALAPHSERGGYINFMDSEDQQRVSENYGPNWVRLVQIKGKYDPGNLFHVNQNIKPA